MGVPMARRLAGEVESLRTFEPNPIRAAALAEAGASSCESPAIAAMGAEIVMVMVATPAQMEEALFGESGAATALAQGATVVVMSTVGPASVRDARDRLARVGVGLLDAPVSGGVSRAGSGELVMMVSGPSSTYESVRPILDRLGTAITHVSENVGDGQAVKLVNQLLAGVHIAAAAEAIGLAQALGLDERAVWEIVRHGAAGSFMLNDRGARMLDHEFEPVRSALSIFVKDMGLVTDTARDLGYAAPLASLAGQLYTMGYREGWGGLDDSAVVKLYERWAGRGD
jgi:3-hydroxyisobutyrate dehydrogenase/putative dehydrogenase